MHLTRRTWTLAGIGTTVALVTIFALVLTHLQPRSSTPGITATSTATVTPSGTSTPFTPAPTPTLTPITQGVLAARKCQANQFVAASGDFSFSAFTEGSLQAFGVGYVLPPDLPTSQPYEVTSSTPSWPDHLGTRAALPGGQMMLKVTMCNTGKTSHTISVVRMTIASLQAASGSRQDVGLSCDGPYPGNTNGCGGGSANTFNDFTVSWPATAAVGTTASATQSDQENVASNTGYSTVWDRLPIILAPGQGYNLRLITPQLAAGTYTFTVGVQTEAGVATSEATYPVFLATGSLGWGGYECMQSALIAQMQAGKEYLCAHSGA